MRFKATWPGDDSHKRAPGHPALLPQPVEISIPPTPSHQISAPDRGDPGSSGTPRGPRDL